MVFLDKSTLWCSHWPCHFTLLQGFHIAETENKPTRAAKANGSSRCTCIHPRGRLPSIVSPMGWHQIQLGQCSNHCPICSVWRTRFCMVHYPGLAAGQRHGTASFTQESECARGSNSCYLPRGLLFHLWILCGFRMQSFRLHC